MHATFSTVGNLSLPEYRPGIDSICGSICLSLLFFSEDFTSHRAMIKNNLGQVAADEPHEKIIFLLILRPIIFPLVQQCISSL